MNTNNKQRSSTASDQAVSESSNSISRRAFIGTAAGVVSAASLGWVGATALTATTAKAAQGNRRKDIRVGMLTAPVTNVPFDQLLDMAKRCRIAALEVVSA
ncbi:MAG: hypothetical protein M1608_03855, partial [Candidatus Omnitrophica bacterium]|nr:hypothetical protein [Candidatus Omnitrophota bacterium]